MKNKIFFALIATIFAVQANAQTKYLTLAQCYNDPFLYIEANYVYNAQRHIGQTVFDFAQELELSVEPSQVVPVMYMDWDGAHPEWQDHFDGFLLHFYYEDLRYTISVYVNPPFLYSKDTVSAYILDETQWTYVYDFILKNNTIKEIYVHKKKAGEYAETYDRAATTFGLTGASLTQFLNQ